MWNEDLVCPVFQIWRNEGDKLRMRTGVTETISK